MAQCHMVLDRSSRGCDGVLPAAPGWPTCFEQSLLQVHLGVTRLEDHLWPTAWQWFVLAAGAYFAPLRIWARNLTVLPSPFRLLAWGTMVFAIGLAIWFVTVRLHAKRESSADAIFWFLIAAGAMGSLISRLPGGAFTAWAITIGIAILAYRLTALPAFRVLSNWAVFVAVILPAFLVGQAATGQTDSKIHDPDLLAVSEFSEKPDVVLVIADEYASQAVIEDVLDRDISHGVGRLEEAGYVISSGMNANYTTTHLSVPTLFEMSYVLDSGEEVTDADLKHLYRVIGGDNRLVQTFVSQGYEFVMIESGSAGMRCIAVVDECIVAPWPSEDVSVAIRRSIMGGIAGEWTKGSATIGSLSGISWLRESLDDYVTNGQPELIYVHLMIPHPPLNLDSSCEYRRVPNMGGRALGSPSFEPEIMTARVDAYVDQVDCVNMVMAEVGNSVPDDTIVILLGDHGSASRGQLFKRSSDWDGADMLERFGAMFAVRASECDFSEIRSLVNVGRRLLGCLDRGSVTLLEDRFFVSNGSVNPIGSLTEPILEIASVPSG